VEIKIEGCFSDVKKLEVQKIAASHICVGDPRMLWSDSCLFMVTGLWVI
jgi:hypothetical protein